MLSPVLVFGSGVHRQWLCDEKIRAHQLGSYAEVLRDWIGGSTSWASEASAGAGNLEVDPASGGVKLDALQDPRRRQPQRAGKQGLNRSTHLGSPAVRKSPVDIWTAARAPAHMPTGQQHQHAF
jgi:hypothetical protein